MSEFNNKSEVPGLPDYGSLGLRDPSGTSGLHSRVLESEVESLYVRTASLSSWTNQTLHTHTHTVSLREIRL